MIQRDANRDNVPAIERGLYFVLEVVERGLCHAAHAVRKRHGPFLSRHVSALSLKVPGPR